MFSYSDFVFLHSLPHTPVLFSHSVQGPHLSLDALALLLIPLIQKCDPDPTLFRPKGLI